jgi:hypothetical protein
MSFWPIRREAAAGLAVLAAGLFSASDIMVAGALLRRGPQLGSAEFMALVGAVQLRVDEQRMTSCDLAYLVVSWCRAEIRPISEP